MLRTVLGATTALATLLIAGAAQAGGFGFVPGDLVVSGSTYTGTTSTIVAGSTILPGDGTAAAYDGGFPEVFNNAAADGSFGVTSPLFLYQYKTGTAAVPSLTANGVYNVTANTGVVTSFSSKSEGALNLSPNGQYLSFVDYLNGTNVLDVSNSNTPGIAEPGNYTQNATARTVVTLDSGADATVLPTNAYPGNNGRAAVDVNGTYYLAGNAGNADGSPAVTAAGGIQTFNPKTATKTAGAYNTQKAGTFNVTNVGLPADKTAKDDNYRGLTIFNNTLFTTKGSGGNGVDTVYQVGTAGTLPGATTAAGSISVLPGFPTDSAKKAPKTGQFAKYGFTPFGLYFANANTLYVADEGDGVIADATKDPNAGLEKWSLSSGTWHLDYTLQAGLQLGVQYSVPGLSSSLDPATDGLRNIAGRLNGDGTVSIFGITSTVSTSGDQGADSNRLVEITDSVGATTRPGAESFTTLQTAGFAQVLRGVSFAPVPEPATIAVFGVALAGLGAAVRRRK